MTVSWTEVADRVYVRRYEELDLTVGLVVGDDGCLVIDTRGDEDQGAELAAAVREITPHPWTVVYTHAHFDHCFGTSAFPGAPVWAHRLCHKDMVEHGDADRRNWSARYRAQGKPAIADALDRTSLVLPTHLVDDRASLSLGGREVSLVYVGLAHSSNDLLVHVPDARVLFVGDLVENGAPPQFGDSHPLSWPTALTTILDFDADVVVAGHGDPVDNDFVASQREELRQVAQLCRSVAANELSTEDAITRCPFGGDTTRTALARMT
ncbi:MBL fold metallo-hydrolase [Allokutzneria sp. A3M-2-11 16]|uniref:MBL fold metallo-hydrolase n=1 Tax=Allokutzneria sp. A3M-2-11 16 TaxID=2962043 RepID=UPI0020B81EED|nr:MBL fold metallo-hydrolase [Allokutzneria sp. A3M-2-11 16]MCP3800907.1 MBL fold metallo-hydrolase [Allokutzneria sp. A3M-2-11 16]